MTTTRTRVLVSLAVTMAATLTLGACLRAPSRAAPGRPAPMEQVVYPFAIRFDNGAREYVHVYLISDQYQWLLGRVEPGAVATLQIPQAALVGSSGLVRLAVIAGERLTPQAARDPRATFTMAQPISAILAQRWTFSQRQLTSLRLRRTSWRGRASAVGTWPPRSSGR